MKELKGWVARDENGMLYLYLAKPKKNQNKWLPDIRSDFVELSRESFTRVKWEDEEPTEVTITIKLDEAQWKTRNFLSSAAGRAITACLTLEWTITFATRPGSSWLTGKTATKCSSRATADCGRTRNEQCSILEPTTPTKNGGTASCRSAVFFGFEEEDGRGRGRESGRMGEDFERTEEDGEDGEDGTWTLRRRTRNSEQDKTRALRRMKQGL